MHGTYTVRCWRVCATTNVITCMFAAAAYDTASEDSNHQLHWRWTRLPAWALFIVAAGPPWLLWLHHKTLPRRLCHQCSIMRALVRVERNLTLPTRKRDLGLRLLQESQVDKPLLPLPVTINEAARPKERQKACSWCCCHLRCRGLVDPGDAPGCSAGGPWPPSPPSLSSAPTAATASSAIQDTVLPPSLRTTRYPSNNAFRTFVQPRNSFGSTVDAFWSNIRHDGTTKIFSKSTTKESSPSAC